jgi:hypothetical protein
MTELASADNVQVLIPNASGPDFPKLVFWTA